MPPDLLRWETEFINKGQSLEEVAAIHSEKVSEILGILRRFGIKEADLQTPRSSFAENWEVVDRIRIMDGYAASTKINFTVEDLSLYTDIWISLSKFADLRVRETQWDITDQHRIQIREQARLAAVRAARRKAEAIAEELKMKVGNPVKISEEGSTFKYSNLSGNFASMSGESDSSENGYAGGTIDVSSSIYIEFSMVSAN